MLKKILFAITLIPVIGIGFVAVTFPGGIGGLRTMLLSVTGFNRAEPPANIAEALNIAPGFTIEVFAEGLEFPRFIRLTDNGDLIVSNPDSGKIELLRQPGPGEKAAAPELLLDNLKNPQGMAFHDQWLYFSERDAVHRIQFDHAAGTTLGEAETLIRDLPYGHAHWSHNSKPIGISPDGQLFISVGSPCNSCVPEDPRYSTLMRSKLDGSDLQIYARGLRNSIGFDWAPWSGALYATDNGADMLGDDFPPDELNLVREGAFYGWPWYHGENHPDPNLGIEAPELSSYPASPAFKFRAHNAPLGIHFIRQTEGLAVEDQQSALVALHGSWNRSQLDGYKVVKLTWQADSRITAEDFLTGFLTDQGVIGRPVDFAEARDGTIYLSDDLGGRIYRIRRN